jgi:hypothetical protein
VTTARVALVWVESSRRNKGEGQVEVEVCDAITDAASLLSIHHLTYSQAVLSSLVEKVSDSLMAVLKCSGFTNHRGYEAGGGVLIAAHDKSSYPDVAKFWRNDQTVVETFDAGNPYRWLYCRIVIKGAVRSVNKLTISCSCTSSPFPLLFYDRNLRASRFYIHSSVRS